MPLLIEQGRQDEAALSLDRARAVTARTGQHLGDVEILRLRARIHRQRGQAGAAAQALREAIDSARALGSPTLALRAALDVHELSGGDTVSLQQLRQVLADMPEPQASTIDLRRAHRLLQPT
ncbi:MAG: hypothetical protein R3E68_02260 [Burkholderiaceae bacterium]